MSRGRAEGKPTREAMREARNEALEEAAGHLELEWTDDPLERQAGNKLAEELRAKMRPHDTPQ